MMNCNLYTTLPIEPLDPPQSYHLKSGPREVKRVAQAGKTLDRLTRLNACSSALRTASRIASVVMLSTFIGFTVSIPLGTVSLAGASVNGVARG